ncbi:MAG: U32 family peptidase, partial [Dehalococcoidales bacterium]|nr:U32 family peptidase [Dehalococcoidales bacterium]
LSFMISTYKQETLLRRPELLSPAGDWDCLLAAVTNGADAVYLGTREFNARFHARNFTLEELGRAINYSHNQGVRVYLTLNTLVKNHEIKRFFNIFSRVYALGIDGVIIQHVSFLEIIKRNFPRLDVFISTQGAIGNASSASLLKSADRIILPRELPLEEIKKIVNSGIRVEVFIHGALCFSYSGLCLFSSFVSNRSGNRGTCAQLCRQKYNGSYPLSTKELCLVRRIPELIQAGITGFKIEGRMRSPLYVAVATRLYRKAIDSFLAGRFKVPQKELAEIEVVFNREFTEGFMFGETSLISPEKPMNRGALLGVIKGGEIVLGRSVAAGDGVGIWGNDKDNVSGTIIKTIILNGKKVRRAAAGDRVNLGLEAKDGSRVYLTSSAQISIKPDFTIKRPPIIFPKRKKVQAGLPEITPRKSSASRLLVKAYSVSEAMESRRAGADLVFYNILAPDFPETEESQSGSSPGAYLPRIMSDDELSQALNLLKKKKPGAILTGNLGFLARRTEFKVPVFLDYSLNAFNDLDLIFFRRYNVIPIISPELSLSELAELQNKDVVVFCHGDVALVNTLVELEDKELISEKGLAFPVRKEAGYGQILNSRPFGLFNDIQKLRTIGFSQFFIDKQNEGAYFTTLYRNILKHDVADRRKRKGYTAGHLYRPVG